MAMDALKNLTNNIPGWLLRLDELSSQVDKRQAELAAIAAAEPHNGSETKSLRNKGSQESLKPQDDGPSNIPPPLEPEPESPAQAENTTSQPAPPRTPPQDMQKPRTPTSPGSGGIAAAHRVPPAAHARAKSQVKKRVRSPSMMSAENAPQAFRTRTMIIVYYDSYVQGFFDDLVRFISSSRNLMRKAKMAAKVAQIKKMAEAEVTRGDGEADSDNPLPTMRYMSSRRMGPMGGLGRPGFGPPGPNDKPDVYDDLDQGLEVVQSTCEHGAHQFLRDADCNDEIERIKQKMRTVLESAHKEIERVQREDPELAKETGELNRPRACRPISIRRELTSSQKDMNSLAKEDSDKLEPARSARSKSSFIEPATSALEVDNNDDDDDEGIDIDAQLSKIQYRSTRGMRQPRNYVPRTGA